MISMSSATQSNHLCFGLPLFLIPGNETITSLVTSSNDSWEPGLVLFRISSYWLSTGYIYIYMYVCVCAYVFPQFNLSVVFPGVYSTVNVKACFMGSAQEDTAAVRKGLLT